MGRLDGKCAVILGAASKDNMGQVMARRFVAEGAKVLVAGRNEDILQDISARLAGITRCVILPTVSKFLPSLQALWRKWVRLILPLILPAGDC